MGRVAVRVALAGTVALILLSPIARADVPCTGTLCTSTPLALQSIYVRTHVGSAEAPFYTEQLPTTSSEITQAISFVIGGHLRVRDDLVVGLRLPTAPSTVEQPAGSYLDAKTFGHPELYAETNLEQLIRIESIRLSARLAIGLPLAGYGPDETMARNRVVAISDAMDMWRDQELYSPGMVPVTTAGRAQTSFGRWQLAGELELPLLIRIHDAGLPDEVNPRRASLVPNLTADVGYWPRRWLGLRLVGSLASQLPAPVEHSGGHVQLAAAPGLAFAIADRWLIATDLSIAIGGPLAGTAGLGLAVVAYR